MSGPRKHMMPFIPQVPPQSKCLYASPAGPSGLQNCIACCLVHMNRRVVIVTAVLGSLLVSFHQVAGKLCQLFGDIALVACRCRGSQVTDSRPRGMSPTWKVFASLSVLLAQWGMLLAPALTATRRSGAHRCPGSSARASGLRSCLMH